MTQQELEHRFQERIAEKFTVINEVLSYKKSQDEINIHLAETRSKGPKEIVSLLVSGMQDLAKVVEDDEEVKRVLATSWIAAHRSGRKQLERLGFTVDEPISDEMRELDFALEEREVGTAHIDREDFLQRYKEQEGRDEST
ncbi:hypothetical protein IH781_04080 [Patescibacteria group bacterium]|nr:hypothetical protein [Patescibacteria group bacterium]